VKEQWVLGGVERESRKTNLVPTPDRTADMLMAVLRDWIEPGTTFINDSWSEYRDYKRMSTHTINLVDVRTGAHTNTIENTWRHVKAFLNLY
jgi:hypothetical protein